MPNLGPTELIVILAALLILAAFFVTVARAISPSPARCVNVLRRWGVEQPSREQAELLAAYFKPRGRVYLPVFVVTAVIVGTAVGLDWITAGLVTVLFSLLVIELGATIRPAFRDRREAALVRRSITDLVLAPVVIAIALVNWVALLNPMRKQRLVEVARTDA